MRNIIYVMVAVGVALSANSIAAVWAKQDNRYGPWLAAVVLISPLVFITYGLVTSRLGVSITSGTVDALLTICSIVVGLTLFKEWDKISSYQYVGIILSLAGIILMVFSPSFKK